MPEIIILTGPVQQGKSSQLHSWVVQQRRKGLRIGGILNPAVEGKKMYVDANNGETIPMEAPPDWPEAMSISIGRFRFRREAFDFANRVITRDASRPNDLFIIDEIGKLELRGEGLYHGISKWRESAHLQTLTIVVVRDFLLDEVIATFIPADSPYRVVDKTYFDESTC